MADALRLATLMGGAKRISLALAVGPHRSLCYGYRTINRLLATGEAVLMRPERELLPSRGAWVMPIFPID